MSVLEALILGIIQGLTEFLPVSSSGHLAIFGSLFGLEESPIFLDGLMHIGTLIAVLLVFRKRIAGLFVAFFAIIGKVFTGRFKWKEASQDEKMMIFLMLSCVPLFIILPLRDAIENLSSCLWLIGAALCVNAVILLLSDYAPDKHKAAEEMTWVDSLVVGFVQCVAILPGISRSGSTITAGAWRGLDRRFVAEYSFILSIPTILAGAVVSILDAVTEGAVVVADLPAYLVGPAAAAVVGFFAIKLLQYLLRTKRFFIFSLYCLIVGVAVIVIALV